MSELAVAVASGLLGVVLTLVIQTYFSMISEEVAVINDHIADIGEIESIACEYWLTDPNDDEAKSIELAARLRGSIHASGCFAPFAQQIFRASYDEYKDLDLKIFDATTDGDFETRSRRAEPQRVTRIMMASNEMRARLRRARRSVFWAR